MRLLITGGTGTLGRAYIRRALCDPKWSAVVSLSRDEVKAAALAQEFASDARLKVFLGDVRDATRLSMALRGVHTVVHAAALKRIDVGAYSPSEFIATNVLGTMNVVNAAVHAGAARVVVISSDKAVHPSNIYGSSKHLAESYAVQANNYGGGQTRICAVRYGNILGSRGSVVHAWRGQIERGEPMTLTDPRMTRFVMTIEAACALVQCAADEMQGGEVFVPILPSATLGELAAAVMPRADYPTVVTGLRPGGEKLAESLLSDEEPARTRLRRMAFPGTDAVMGCCYTVTPTHHEWVGDGFAWAGTPVVIGSAYRSDGPGQDWVSAEDLRELIAHTEAMR